MKRKPQRITILLCIVIFLGAAGWYWLSEDAAIESPVLSPSIEAPPAGNSNVAANLPPPVVSQNLAPRTK